MDGIIAGIKVDIGAKKLTGYLGETITAFLSADQSGELASLV
jgi:hypothetical protein